MPRYKLRTLLIVRALGPPIIWGGWSAWREYVDYRQRQRIRAALEAMGDGYGPGLQIIPAAPVVDPGGQLGPTADLDLQYNSGRFDEDGRHHPLFPDREP